MIRKSRDLLISSILMRFLTQASQYILYALLPILAIALHSNENEIKITTVVFLFSRAIAVFFSSLIIATQGASKSFWLAVCLFMTGCVICFFSHHAWSMSEGYCFQGLGTGLLLVLSKNMLLRKQLLLIYQITLNFFPLMSILISIFILDYFSWRVVFLFLFFAMFLSIFTEHAFHSLQIISSPPSHITAYIQDSIELIKNRAFLRLLFSYGLVHAIQALFYVNVPFWIANVLHYPSYMFVYVVGLFSIISLLGSISILYLKKYESHFIILIGFWLCTIGISLFTVTIELFHFSFWIIVGSMGLHALGIALFYVDFNHLFLEKFGKNNSAIISSCQAISMISLSALVVYLAVRFQLHHKEIAYFMLVLTISSFILYLRGYWTSNQA